MKWSETVTILGVLALSIVGAAVGALPPKLVTALVMAVVGYIAAVNALRKRSERRREIEDRHQGRDGHGRHDGAVPEPVDHAVGSGGVVIQKQTSGGRVTVHSDGTVVIGPPEGEDHAHDEPGPFDEPRDDRTPTDATAAPTGTDGTEE